MRRKKKVKVCKHRKKQSFKLGTQSWPEAWKHCKMVRTANINFILTPPPQSLVIISADGFCGAHEWTVYPQLHHHEF